MELENSLENQLSYERGRIFSLASARIARTVKAVSKERYKKSLLFPLDGSHS